MNRAKYRQLCLPFWIQERVRILMLLGVRLYSSFVRQQGLSFLWQCAGYVL